MKPTQEQIEAALRHADQEDTRPNAVILTAYNPRHMLSFNAVTILTAAYREAMAEIERLKPWADLAISSNALLEIERSKNKQ